MSVISHLNRMAFFYDLLPEVTVLMTHHKDHVIVLIEIQVKSIHGILCIKCMDSISLFGVFFG